MAARDLVLGSCADKHKSIIHNDRLKYEKLVKYKLASNSLVIEARNNLNHQIHIARYLNFNIRYYLSNIIYIKKLYYCKLLKYYGNGFLNYKQFLTYNTLNIKYKMDGLNEISNHQLASFQYKFNFYYKNLQNKKCKLFIFTKNIQDKTQLKICSLKSLIKYKSKYNSIYNKIRQPYTNKIYFFSNRIKQQVDSKKKYILREKENYINSLSSSSTIRIKSSEGTTTKQYLNSSSYEISLYGHNEKRFWLLNSTTSLSKYFNTSYYNSLYFNINYYDSIYLENILNFNYKTQTRKYKEFLKKKLDQKNKTYYLPSSNISTTNIQKGTNYRNQSFLDISIFSKLKNSSFTNGLQVLKYIYFNKTGNINNYNFNKQKPKIINLENIGYFASDSNQHNLQQNRLREANAYFANASQPNRPRTAPARHWDANRLPQRTTQPPRPTASQVTNTGSHVPLFSNNKNQIARSAPSGVTPSYSAYSGSQNYRSNLYSGIRKQQNWDPLTRPTTAPAPTTETKPQTVTSDTTTKEPTDSVIVGHVKRSSEVVRVPPKFVAHTFPIWENCKASFTFVIRSILRAFYSDIEAVIVDFLLATERSLSAESICDSLRMGWRQITSALETRLMQDQIVEREDVINRQRRVPIQVSYYRIHPCAVPIISHRINMLEEEIGLRDQESEGVERDRMACAKCERTYFMLDVLESDMKCEICNEPLKYFEEKMGKSEEEVKAAYSQFGPSVAKVIKEQLTCNCECGSKHILAIPVFPKSDDVPESKIENNETVELVSEPSITRANHEPRADIFLTSWLGELAQEFDKVRKKASSPRSKDLEEAAVEDGELTLGNISASNRQPEIHILNDAELGANKTIPELLSSAGTIIEKEDTSELLHTLETVPSKRQNQSIIELVKEGTIACSFTEQSVDYAKLVKEEDDVDKILQTIKNIKVAKSKRIPGLPIPTKAILVSTAKWVATPRKRLEVVNQPTKPSQVHSDHRCYFVSKPVPEKYIQTSKEAALVARKSIYDPTGVLPISTVQTLLNARIRRLEKASKPKSTESVDLLNYSSLLKPIKSHDLRYMKKSNRLKISNIKSKRRVVRWPSVWAPPALPESRADYPTSSDISWRGINDNVALPNNLAKYLPENQQDAFLQNTASAYSARINRDELTNSNDYNIILLSSFKNDTPSIQSEIQIRGVAPELMDPFNPIDKANCILQPENISLPPYWNNLNNSPNTISIPLEDTVYTVPFIPFIQTAGSPDLAKYNAKMNQQVVLAAKAEKYLFKGNLENAYHSAISAITDEKLANMKTTDEC